MEKVFLTDICDIQYGYAFDSKLFSDTKGRPVIRIRDIVRGYSETYTTEECPGDYIIHNDDILIGMDGEFNIALWKGGEAVLNQRVCKLIPHNEICKNYIFYYMPIALKVIEDKTPFVTVKHLSAKELNKIELPLPTYEMQNKIANSLFNLDELIEKRKKQLSKLDELVKARFVELFGDPVDNPMNWPVKRLRELSVQINSGNTPKGGSKVYVNKGIIFFRSQNVWKDRLEMEDIAYIDEKTHLSMKRSSLKHGDILMTKTGRINTENSSLGRAALYLGEDDAANVNGHVYFIRLKPEVNNHFVLRILVSKEYRDLIRSVCVGGIDKRQLNKEHIEDFPIICPPTDMIEDYIAFVKHTDKSKLEVQKSLEKLELLKKALMQKYFG